MIARHAAKTVVAQVLYLLAWGFTCGLYCRLGTELIWNASKVREVGVIQAVAWFWSHDAWFHEDVSSALTFAILGTIPAAVAAVLLRGYLGVLVAVAAAGFSMSEIVQGETIYLLSSWGILSTSIAIAAVAGVFLRGSSQPVRFAVGASLAYVGGLALIAFRHHSGIDDGRQFTTALSGIPYMFAGLGAVPPTAVSLRLVKSLRPSIAE